MDCRKDGKEPEVDAQEIPHIPLGIAGMQVAVFGQRDQAGERSDRRAQSADIDCDEQRSVLVGEVRQQYRARYVTDDLTAAESNGERSSLHPGREPLLDRGDAREIAREDKERTERQQQGIVNAKQCFGRKDQHEYRHGEQTPIIREQSHDHADRQDKHRAVQHRFGNVIAVGQRRGDGNGFFAHEHTGADDQHQCDAERDRHDTEKFSRRDRVVRIQVQVLRIAERREHAAEIGGDVLHDEGKRHEFLFFAGLQRKKSERQECDQRHIVGKDHGSEIRDHDERQHDTARRDETAQDGAGKQFEKVDLTERADDGERTEQTGQRAPVKIVFIRTVGRHKKTRDRRGGQGDPQYDMFAEEAPHTRAQRQFKLGRLFHRSYCTRSPGQMQPFCNGSRGIKSDLRSRSCAKI